MAYIHVYKGTVNQGLKDGVCVSEGSNEIPISVGPLNSALNQESGPIKLGIRCDDGYETTENTFITPVGTNADKWALAPDQAGVPGEFNDYGAGITLSSKITSTNTVFWLKAKALSGENPSNDISVKLKIEYTIAAVANG